MPIFYYTQITQYIAKLLKNKYVLLALLLLVVGTFFRFYRLSEFVMFLGDQGRDALVVKRILTFEHLPAIGAPTSVGQVYLGPFYYYFIAPWLFIFQFNPVGLAYGVAFFSSLFIFIYFYVVREFFDNTVAIIATFFLTFSSSLVELSRFSWNPNILPMFSFLYVFVFIKALLNGRRWLYAASGCLLAISIQLHYLSIFLIPATIIIILHQMYKYGTTRKKILNNSLVFSIFFSLISSPLVIFDIRHNFLNTKNLFSLITSASGALDNRIERYLLTLTDFLTYSLGVHVQPFFSGIIIILFIISCIYFLKINPISIALRLKYLNNARRGDLLDQQTHEKGGRHVVMNQVLKYILLFFVFSAAGFIFFSGKTYIHYFGHMYPLFYIIVAFLLTMAMRVNCAAKYLVALLVIGFVMQNINNYPFILKKGGNQVERAKSIAKIIYDGAGERNYRLTALPERYEESTYRYFLEIWKKKPIERDSTEYVDELFVVCEGKCNPIGNPQWDVAVFAPSKIVSYWTYDNVYIYKLTNKKI